VLELKKSVELAKLMGWRKQTHTSVIHSWGGTNHAWNSLEPYVDSITGLAQFALIMLKFYSELHEYVTKEGNQFYNTRVWLNSLSKEDMLDLILKMKGIKLDKCLKKV